MKALGFLMLFAFHFAFAAEPKLLIPDNVKENLEDRLHVSLGASYSFNGLMKFDPVRFSENDVVNEETTAEFKFRNAGAIEIDLRYLNPYSLGFIGGATFEEQRRLSSGKLTGSETVWILLEAVQMNIKVDTYYINAAYRSDEFYFFLGGNYSSVKMSSPTPLFEKMNTSSQFGWQYGIGFYINDDIVVELTSRKVSYSLDVEYDGGTIDFAKGGFTSVSFGTKYVF